MKITIFAHPNSRHPRIDKDLLGSLHVYVDQPPLENKANMAVIEALAEYHNVSKSRVKLIRGEKSKQKTFEIM
jgi:uncharacterized protein YggU (UPF0235/DUF167 family)